MPKLYTVQQVADLLGCSRKTVYGLAASNAIPHLRIGRLIRFDPEVIERWIKQQMDG